MLAEKREIEHGGAKGANGGEQGVHRPLRERTPARAKPGRYRMRATARNTVTITPNTAQPFPRTR